jgi:ribosomal protein L33
MKQNFRFLFITLFFICYPLQINAAYIYQYQFDSFVMGQIIEIKEIDSRYDIVLDGESGTSWTYTIQKDSPQLKDVIDFLKIRKESPGLENPKAIFLLNDNALCGFTYGYTDGIAVSKYRKINNKFVVLVCTTETDKCYTLNISSKNILYDDAENIPNILIKKKFDPEVGLYVIFDKNYEIISIDEYGALLVN